MAAIVVAAAAAVAAETIIVSATSAAFAATLWGKAAIAVTGAVLNAAGNSFLSGNPDSAPSTNFDNVARGALVNVGGNDEPIPVIYGSRRVGGVFALREVTGATNDKLQMILVWSEGPIAGVDQIYLDGVPYTDSPYTGYVRVEHRLGTDDQTAIAELVAAMPGRWTAQHTLAGLAYTWIELSWSANAFPQGVPTITADVRGRTVYDPRTATTAHSNNAALCTLDYLTNTRYGRGIDATIDPVHVVLTGTGADHAYTDDSSTVSVTGDLDVFGRFVATDWTPAATSTLIAKWGGAPQRTFLLRLLTSGALSLQTSPDGTTITTASSSSVATGFANGAAGWVRVTRNATTGAVLYYTAPDQPAPPTTWTQLGTAGTSTVGTMHDATARLTVGAQNNSVAALAGKCYYAELRGTIGGSAAAVFDPDRDATPGAATFEATATGETWTMNGAATLAGTRTDIAWRQFMLAADACDVTISTPAGSLAKYTVDGLVNTDASLLDNTRSLLTASRGALVRSGRSYRLVVDQAETATGFDFNEDNIVGAWVIRPAGKRDKFNRVTAKFFNAAGEWQPDYAVWESAADRTADHALVLESEMALPYTSSFYRAQYMAQLEQRASRYGIVCQFRATLAGLDCEVGDVVTITHSTPDWTAKPFRVLRMDILNSDEVEVTAREYQASVYSTDTLDTAPVVPATNLPRVWEVSAPGAPVVGESIYETTSTRRVQALMQVSWAAAADAFVREYEVSYKLAADSTWTTLPRTGGLTAEVLDIAPGTYQVRVRAFNSVGVDSAWSPTTTREILGLSAQPGTLTGLAIQKIGSQALITLDQSADLDVRRGGRILVRHSEATSSAEWEASFSIGNERGYPGDAVSVLVPLKAGTYLLKAEDTSGQQSATAATVASDGATALAWSALGSVTEDGTFPGTFSDCAASGGVLKLSAAGLFDDITSLDEMSDIDSLGGIVASGTYTFSAGLDLGAVTRAQLYSMLEGSVDNVNDRFDDRTGNIDDWLDFDGATAGGACDAWVEVRSTNDNPAGSPTWSDWQRLDRSEYNARGFQFRAQLRSTDPAYNILVTTLRVYAQAVA